MNKGYFSINEYLSPTEISPEISYSDLSNGMPDTMTFAFKYNKDLSYIPLGSKCYVELYDKDYPLVGDINFETKTIVVREETYTYNEDNYIVVNSKIIGYVDLDKEELSINNDLYYFTLSSTKSDLYYDNRIKYYMALSQITSEKMSTNSDKNYFITVSLKEQTIYLKNCIKTDIAITPSLYPNNIFNTLLDATKKIVDCHNLCTLNVKIEDIDLDLAQALSEQACPNLTYRDLSTYSQLYDVFMRVGRIPYFENGILYGIIVDGNKDRVLNLDIDDYSSVSSIKEDGVNSNIYSSKIYNTIYDEETAIVPQIFEDVIRKTNTPFYSDYPNRKIYYFGNYKLSDEYVGSDGLKRIDILDDNGVVISYIKGNNIYQVATNYSDYYFVDDYHKSKTRIYFAPNLKLQGGEDRFASTSFKGNFTSYNDAFAYAKDEFNKWVHLSSQDSSDISKTLLFVKGFDPNSQDIDDARSYSLELPYNIELVKNIYSCEPYYIIDSIGSGEDTTYRCIFGWRIFPLQISRVIETSSFNNLSSLQKRTMCHYTRGTNTIHNIISLIADEKYLQGDVKWSSAVLYSKLRNQFFVVEYKPILDGIYTDYNYNKEFDGLDRPKSINNMSLPYSQVSDKQVFPVLDYNLNKGLDTTTTLKVVSDNLDLLKYKAGDLLNYNGKKYIINNVTHYINNVTIESTYSISSNIVTNSLLSSYRDNVRVSSILSAESVVNRSVHLFAENVISAYGDTNVGNETQKVPNEFVTESIGQTLAFSSMKDYGLYSGKVNTYTDTSKFPFRFDKIIEEYDENSDETKFVIKMSGSSSSINNSKSIEILESEFPVTLQQISNTIFSTSVTSEIKCDNYEELYRKLNEFYYLVETTIFNSSIPLAYFYLRIKHGSKTEDLRPDFKSEGNATLYGWISTLWIDLINGQSINGGSYSVYNSKEYSTTKYLTEKLMTTTGLITKIEYCSPSSSYCTYVYDSTKLPEPTSQELGKIVIPDLSISEGSPALFNTTTEGCKLAGIGNSKDIFYSLGALPHISTYGYYLDLRENPRPYIQYKTMFRNTNDTQIKIKQLNSNVRWLEPSMSEAIAVSPYNEYRILKVKKDINIDTQLLNLSYDDVENITASKGHIGRFMSNGVSARIDFDTNIERDDNFDYVLCAYSSLEQNKINYENLFRFEISGDKSVSSITIKSEIYSND